MQRRTRSWAPWAGLATLVLAHGTLLAWWIRRDARPDRSICCDLIGPVAQRAAAHATSDAGPALAWSPDRGLLPEAGMRMIRWLDGNPDGLLHVGALGLLVAMVAVFDLSLIHI